MPDDINPAEILVTPLAGVVRQVCQSIADAQSALDKAALDTQRNLRTLYPELEAIGYQVTWYQFPEVLIEVKMALHYERSEGGKGKVLAALFNAKYKNAFSYAVDGASSVKLKVVPIPPPVAVPPMGPTTPPGGPIPPASAR